MGADAHSGAGAGTLVRPRRSPPAGNSGRGWRLRAGHLVIVDEASLAATRTLDHLVGHHAAAAAKVLLLGDHHQLGAINAGGAFALLAHATRAPELTLLWRFRHRWQA